MTGNTSIEWTDRSWNPTTGCTRVSPGCEHCYAFTLHDRRHAGYKRDEGIYPNGKPMPKQYQHPFSVIQLLPERLEEVLHIRTPQRFFVDSMSDLFHSKIPDAYIYQVFDVMKRAHWHVFQVLTKRGNRLQRLAHSLDWPANIWIGVSVENDLLTKRVDQLRSVPAVVRFLSCEPLLEPLPSLCLDGLQWVITGGESGAGARPCDPTWVRDLRDRCVATGVPFFFKQWGGRTSKAGGRDLDGRTWDEMPLALEQSALSASSKKEVPYESS